MSTDNSGSRVGLGFRTREWPTGDFDEQLVDFRHDRRWDPRMEHFADRHHLPDAQAIADVAAYISRLDVRLASGEGSGDLLGLGAASYARLCRGCHGAVGQGEARGAVPRLAGQHYEYLRRQIFDAVDGRRPNFSQSHIRLLARLDHGGIDSIADYLSRLGSEDGHTGAGNRLANFPPK